jgi:trans-aconitate methyltransferase
MTLRTHDLLYLNENRYEGTKESFKFTLKTALEFSDRMPRSILDVGCAAGEFPFFLVRAIEGAHIHGMDVMPELVEKARQVVPEAEFFVGSVLDPEATSGAFDMVFLVGVHSIFDEIEPWLSNLLKWTNPGGTVAVFGLIN